MGSAGVRSMRGKGGGDGKAGSTAVAGVLCNLIRLTTTGVAVDVEKAGMWSLGEGFVGRGVWMLCNANRMNKMGGRCGGNGRGCGKMRCSKMALQIVDNRRVARQGAGRTPR